VAAAAPRRVEASVSQAATIALPVPAAPPRPTLHPITVAHREVVATAAAGVGLEPLPDLGRLSYYDPVSPDTADLHAKARLIEATLNSFKVEARVREINPGPAVTQFALEPGTGIKVRRITELQNDLALALAAPSIRIEAPVPGHARVGLEIPNAHIATVGLRETLESQAMTKGKAKLPMPLGQDVNGRHVVGDLTRMPHILIAGATGAGKSVCLNCIISTFLLAKRPSDLKLVMIDPKMVELTGYNGVPHLQCPVVTEMDKVVGALRLTVREMERRYALFAQLGVRNYDGYRLKIADEPNAERIPYLVVIIDELADLMMTTPDEVETLLVRLGQMGRAAGIHLILATQRPSVDVVTGLIKTNVPSRIAFAVSSLTDSRVVLDMPGAERLLGRGDMLYLPADAAKPQRIQGAFLDDRDAQYVVDHWHGVAPVPNYAPEWIDLPSSNSGGGSGSGSFDPNEDGDDPLFDQALGIVKQQGNASASMLQRRLRVGYNRAARLIERMEDEGLIGPADGVRGRPSSSGTIEGWFSSMSLGQCRQDRLERRPRPPDGLPRPKSNRHSWYHIRPIR
jgi:S-DNA-T family DNA segregation ATPase FtsK/SpoIIIE